LLETVAKEDLEAFIKANDILPKLQHGFRKGRSCTTALATAHAAWVWAKAKAKVVAVVGFDLSAAFDTVGREDLLPKMLAMGIGGMALRWFGCYLTNAKQRLVWAGLVSDLVDVEYGVRQGSLLGPVFYLLHVSDLLLALEIRETHGDSVHRQHSCLGRGRGCPGGAAGTTTASKCHGEVHKAQRPCAQWGQDVMIGGKAKARDNASITISVKGALVKPANSFELLGITFNRQFTVQPYLHSLAREARFRAGRVARLSQHLPRGQLLRQLGSGLLIGKLEHCLPVLPRLRLPGSTGTIPEMLASVQVTVNDVARSVVGHRREDHISIVDLLEAAKYLQVVRATAMSAWSAYASNNGTSSTRNPVGSWMFGNVNQPATATPTRATTAGEVRVPTRGMDTHVTHGLETWNACAELHGARSKAEANRAATRLAWNSPL
jgi:hypothetical protein